VDLDSFWISCATTSIPPAEASLDELSIRSGSTIVIKTRGTGGSSIQRSLEYFLTSSRPPDCTTSSKTQHSLKVLCWNCTSLGSFTQSARGQELDLLLASGHGNVCLLQEIRCPAIHINRFETTPFGPALAGATVSASFSSLLELMESS